MAIILPPGYVWDDQLRMGEETEKLAIQVWPNYLVLESDIPEPGLTFEISMDEFARRFPVWGVRDQSTQELMAYINAVQLFVDLSADQLPQEGWRYAIQSAGSSRKPNCLCLLVANASPKTRGSGVAQCLIDRTKEAALNCGFDTMIAPVRPTFKHKFPDISMDEYIQKKNEAGEVFDPWLRQHVNSGGEILNVCEESVLIDASLGKWREWTGLSLTEAGAVQLPGGLDVLNVNLEKNIGTYREPNVWVRYKLK